MAKSLFEFFKGFDPTVFFREEVVPNEFYEDNLIVTSEGNISAGFVLDLPQRENITAEEINEIHDEMISILKRLPAGTVIHKQDQYFYKYPEALKKSSGEGFYNQKLRQHFADKRVLSHRVVLYLCTNPKNQKRKNPATTQFSSFRGLRKKFENSLGDIYKNKLLAENQAYSLFSQLNTTKVKARRLETKELVQEVYRYENLEFGTEQFALKASIHNTLNEVTVGTRKARFISLNEIGDLLYTNSISDRQVAAPMAWPFGHNLPFEHVVNTTMWIADTEKELEDLTRLRKFISSLGKMSDQESELVAKNIDQFTLQARNNKDSLSVLDQNVMIWDADPNNLRIYSEMVNAAYRKMNGSSGLEETFDSGSLFRAYSPGNALQMFRGHKMIIDHALTFFDWTQPMPSEAKGILLSNRDHEPVLLDLWSDALQNKNRITIGPTGSGKSFTMNYLLTQLKENNCRIIIIDVGGSYKNVVRHFKGKYFEASESNPFKANPFLWEADSAGSFILTEERLVFLKSLINIIWKDTANNLTMSKEEDAVVGEFLNLYYANVNEYNAAHSDERILPRFDRFIAFLEDYLEQKKNTDEVKRFLKFFSIDSFKITLKTFVEGSYSGTLNADSNMSIAEEDLVAFDLNGIKESPTLYPIVGLIIMQLIQENLKTGTKRIEIVIDEAWSLLGDSLGEFFEGLYRTIRKSNGAITMVSQGVVELIKAGSVGLAIRQNAETVIILDHKSAASSLPQLQEFFAFTNHQIQMIKSIRDEGTSRDVFIKRGPLAQLFAINPGPHLTAIFSSKKEDRKEMERLVAIAGDDYAINQIVEDRQAI